MAQGKPSRRSKAFVCHPSREDMHTGVITSWGRFVFSKLTLSCYYCWAA